MPGLLDGIRVVELASERAAFAGKLMADLGADVILVEPPGGHYTRTFEPFLDDEPDPESSLWWWNYNTSKRGVTIDAEEDAEALRRLMTTADIVLEAEQPGRLAGIGIDYDQLAAESPSLIWVSVTPFGRTGPRSAEESIDLTAMASGGPVWSCGYDDHTIPPVRVGGNQSYHTASIWAVMGALTAYLERQVDVGGRGQLVDVNMHAASNVTTERGSHQYLVNGQTVQRQTGRHANPERTTETVVTASDGRAVSSGVPPRNAKQFQVLLDWLRDLGIADQLNDLVFVEMATELDGYLPLREVGLDPVVTSMFAAGRDALVLIAEHVTAYDFFVEGQRRGLTTGIIYSPEEVMEDPHFQERGFVVHVEHEAINRTIRYPGAPFRSSTHPHHVTRAPNIGEHNAEVLS